MLGLTCPVCGHQYDVCPCYLPDDPIHQIWTTPLTDEDMSNYRIDGQAIDLIDEWFSDDGEKLIRFFLADRSIRFYVVKG